MSGPESREPLDPVKRQYETYPYPPRDPADEAKRLISASPSNLLEIDHFIFRGRRDWSKPFRALVAGGGTGDALIMMAQRLADVGCPAEVVYLDMSTASREIAEARARVRGLTNIRFVTGDLLEAPDLGPFDYIDCCGVLHHLPDPQAGFDALSAALDDEGGMGVMVYGPLGRTGVYPLQEAFGALLGGDAPETQVALARKVLNKLPASNWLGRNPYLGDHKSSDSGLFDLLLHSRDRPFAVADVHAALEGAGLALVSFLHPARYDPLRYLPRQPEFAERVARLDQPAREALAERLAGDMKTHVFYAAKAARAAKAMARLDDPNARPHLIGVAPQALAQQIGRIGEFKLDLGGSKRLIEIPKNCAPLIARLDPDRSMGEIAEAARMDWMAFTQTFLPAHRALTGYNMLRYSRLPALRAS